LIIDLSLDCDSQKKTLGKNISHTGSSFGRAYPEMILHGNNYDPNEWKLLEKDPHGSHYYVLNYEYDLSKVRTIKVFNQFDCMVTLFERYNSFMRLFR
jgi:hypothetical protein